LNNCRSVFDEDHLSLHRADIINSSFAPGFARATAEENLLYSRTLEEEFC
jgi:hypothetical protein